MAGLTKQVAERMLEMSKFRTSDDYISRHVSNTKSAVSVTRVTLEMSSDEAFALCNVLEQVSFGRLKHALETNQEKALSEIGKALGLLVDHPIRAFDLVESTVEE